MIVLAALACLHAGWKLVWSDEFNSGAVPDPAKWAYERGFVRNKELQWYSDQNARVENGCLVIEGRRAHFGVPDYDPRAGDWRKSRMFANYTSSALETRNLHQWTFGRFEVRARIDPQDGLWPAIWFLGYGPWPGNGEIDLMEYYRKTVLANVAWGTGGGVWDTVKTPLSEFTQKDPKWAEKFHVWRMDWNADWIVLSLDGRVLNRTDLAKTINPDGSNPFHKPHFIILNMAIGATGGDPTPLAFPRKLEIDYVRVYQEESEVGYPSS